QLPGRTSARLPGPPTTPGHPSRSGGRTGPRRPGPPGPGCPPAPPRTRFGRGGPLCWLTLSSSSTELPVQGVKRLVPALQRPSVDLPPHGGVCPRDGDAVVTCQSCGFDPKLPEEVHVAADPTKVGEPDGRDPLVVFLQGLHVHPEGSDLPSEVVQDLILGLLARRDPAVLFLDGARPTLLFHQHLTLLKQHFRWGESCRVATGLPDLGKNLRGDPPAEPARFRLVAGKDQFVQAGLVDHPGIAVLAPLRRVNRRPTPVSFLDPGSGAARVRDLQYPADIEHDEPGFTVEHDYAHVVVLELE